MTVANPGMEEQNSLNTYQQALKYCEQALAIYQNTSLRKDFPLESRLGEANTLFRIGKLLEFESGPLGGEPDPSPSKNPVPPPKPRPSQTKFDEALAAYSEVLEKISKLENASDRILQADTLLKMSDVLISRMQRRPDGEGLNDPSNSPNPVPTPTPTPTPTPHR